MWFYGAFAAGLMPKGPSKRDLDAPEDHRTQGARRHPSGHDPESDKAIEKTAYGPHQAGHRAGHEWHHHGHSRSAGFESFEFRDAGMRGGRRIGEPIDAGWAAVGSGPSAPSRNQA